MYKKFYIILGIITILLCLGITSNANEINIESNNANLQSLRIDREGIVPDFNKEIKEYYLTIPNVVNEIEVLAIGENPKATIKITGNNKLQEGLNTIEIKIESEDKTQNNIYKIYVTKTQNLEEANTNLEMLAIEDILLTPPFNTKTTNYKAEIPYETNKLNILAIPENENATVQIEGKEDLKTENNLVKITVTAQDGTTKKVFKIDVYRRNKEEEKNYKEEQIDNKEKLEQIYKAERTSSKTTAPLQKVEDNKIIAVVIIATIIGIIYLIAKKRKKEQNR